MNLPPYMQLRLVRNLERLMEVVKWGDWHKLPDGRYAIAIDLLNSTASEGQSILEDLNLSELAIWRDAVGWPDSTASFRDIALHIGLEVGDLMAKPQKTEDFYKGMSAWEQTNITGDADKTHSLFNKNKGNQEFWLGVYESKKPKPF